jgi:hypothetical protein
LVAVGKLLGEMLSEPSCRNTRVVLLPSPNDATELFCFRQQPMEADLLAAIDDPAVREVSETERVIHGVWECG